MSWQARHEGSPKTAGGLSLQQLVQGLRDGLWEPTDEVKGPSDTTWRHFEDHPQFTDVLADMEPVFTGDRDDETHVDMNALIDVCMVLLIFFMITTTHVAVVQKIIPLPESSPDPKTGRKKYTVTQVKKYMIRVQALGQPDKTVTIRVEESPVKVKRGEGIDKDALRMALQPHVRAGSGKTEMLLLARGISWGQAIAIQDAAKAAGIVRIHRLKQ